MKPEAPHSSPEIWEPMAPPAQKASASGFCFVFLGRQKNDPYLIMGMKTLFHACFYWFHRKVLSVWSCPVECWVKSLMQMNNQTYVSYGSHDYQELTKRMFSLGRILGDMVWGQLSKCGFKSPLFLMKNVLISVAMQFCLAHHELLPDLKEPWVSLTKPLKPPTWILKLQQDPLVAKTAFASLISMIYIWVQSSISWYASKCHLATLTTHSIMVTWQYRCTIALQFYSDS